MAFLLTGCDQVSTFFCAIINSQEECIARVILEDKNNIRLVKNILVNDMNDSISISAPTNNWIKLTPGNNKHFPFRTLRLIHGSSTSFLDVSVIPTVKNPAYKMATTEINAATKSYSDKIEKLPTNTLLKYSTDSAYLRRCFTRQDNANGCVYSLVVKGKPNDIVLFGSVALGIVEKSELEALINSMNINVIQNQK